MGKTKAYPRFPENMSFFDRVCELRRNRKILQRTITVELIISMDDEYSDAEEIEECAVEIYCNGRPVVGFIEGSHRKAGSLSGFINNHFVIRDATVLCLAEALHVSWVLNGQYEAAGQSLGAFYRDFVLKGKRRIALRGRGHPKKFDEAQRQVIRFEYKWLHSRCSKYIKPYHDAAAAMFWGERKIMWDSREVSRRERNLETWRDEWVRHAKEKFSDMPAELLKLFSGDDAPSAEKAVKVYLARKHGTGRYYLGTLLTDKSSERKASKSRKQKAISIEKQSNNIE